jgi:glycosyltransferase involved in cell wall biosynthesis
MRILICTDYWKSSQGGGISSYLSGLIQRLIDNDKDNQYSIMYIHSDKNNYIRIHEGRLRCFIESFLTYHRIQPNTINVHQNWFMLLAGCIYKMINNKTKLIYTVHTEPDIVVANRRNLLLLIKKIPFQYAINACDHVIFVSAKLQLSVKERLGINVSKPIIIYGGINFLPVTNTDKNEFNAKYQLPTNSIIILMQAFTALKVKADGVKLMIMSIKSLLAKYPNIILLITRNGKYIPELKKFAEEQHMSHKIIFTGDINNPYVPLSLANIYAHITYADGLPISLLEAMAIGKPIIASNIGGIPEAITDNECGLLVDNNMVEIADALTKLIENTNLGIKFGDNAVKTLNNKFNWDINVHDYIKIFKSD